MLSPLLCTRVEEKAESPGLWVKRAKIGAFVAVAAPTGICQTIGISSTTVLFGNYMVNLMGKKATFPGSWQYSQQ